MAGDKTNESIFSIFVNTIALDKESCLAPLLPPTLFDHPNQEVSKTPIFPGHLFDSLNQVPVILFRICNLYSATVFPIPMDPNTSAYK